MTKSNKLHPKDEANILSTLTFYYNVPLFNQSLKRDFEEDDLFKVSPRFQSKTLGDKVEKAWKILQNSGKPSLIRLFFVCYGRQYCFLALIQLVVKLLTIFMQPLALSRFIAYFKNNQNSYNKFDAYTYGSLLIGTHLINCIYLHNYRLALTELGIKVRTGICSFIYRKILKLDHLHLGDTSVGKIVTIITKDVAAIELFIHFANDIIVGFVQTVVIATIVYRKIGIAALIGIGLFLIVLPLQIFIGKVAIRWRTKMSKITDERLALIQEILSAIKLIKMYTWEKFFYNKTLQCRRKEMKHLSRVFMLTLAVLQLGILSSKAAFYLLIMSYTWFGNHLSAEVVYFIDSCFQIMTQAMSLVVPIGISRGADMMTAVKRIESILEKAETKPSSQKIMYSKAKIVFKNATIQLNGKFIIENVNLNINTGLTVIVGATGSGKSLLIQAILQNLPVNEGFIASSGTISYASQEPWLFPSSVKENILFGENFEESKYKKVLQVCCLEEDLKSLPQADSTIVEDNGSNLSRGQQVRINLARAVYKDSDIYLLDDCLSSLDIHVKNSIMNECISNFLANKLVVLVTHTMNCKPDNVLMLNNAHIEDSSGTELSGDNVEIEETEDVTEKTNLLDTKPKNTANIYHETKKLGKVSYKMYIQYVKFGGSIIAFLLVVLAFAISQFVSSYSDKLISQWVNLEQLLASSIRKTDENLVSKRDTLLNLYTSLTLLLVVLFMVKGFALFTKTKKVSLEIHKQLAHSIIKAKLMFFDDKLLGNILNRFSKDLTVIDEQIPMLIYHLSEVLLEVIGIVILISYVNFVFLIPILFLFTLLVCLRNYCQPATRSFKRLEASTRSPMVGHINATFDGLATIRAFNAEKMLSESFDKHQDLYTSATYSYQCAQRTFAYYLDFLCTLFNAVVVYKFLIFSDDIPAGSVGLALSQSFLMTRTMQRVIRYWTDIENNMTSVERVVEYIQTPLENRLGLQIDKWPERGSLSFHNVSLKYKNSEFSILKNLNFEIDSMEKVAIVGRTGAGKSSIITTLFRLYDIEGIIKIDNQNTKIIDIKQLRRSMSLIPQEPVLFRGSIRDNLDPEKKYQDASIWKALENVQMNTMFASLDKEINGNVDGLSLGQKQLICIARAILKNNKIVILDEATANLDLETDRQIQETIQKCFVDCTMLVIAHKLESVSQFDKILVVDKGQIVEFGTPTSLQQNKNGFFYQMMQKYQKQNESFFK